MIRKANYSKNYTRTEPLLTQTKGLMRRFHLQARKSLGQHFLVDKEICKLIIAAAKLSDEDVVMEIGPGLGVMTRELARQAGAVVAVELDDKLAVILKQTLASFSNVSIVNRDILTTNPAVLLQEQKAESLATMRVPLGYKLVANLPYYITSITMRHFLETSLKPEVMVVMMQKEVAEAIVAKPGKSSVLSISVQFYGKPEIVNYVMAKSFYPVPKVDSAILKIVLYDKPIVAVTDEQSFFKLVRAGFSASRKQIANSLAQGLAIPKDDVLILLSEAGLKPHRRAETLTLEEWAQLNRAFTQIRKPC